MKAITIFGLPYSQHISPFAYLLKKYGGYRFYGVNKKSNYILGGEYYKQSQETFDEIYDLPRSKFKVLDIIQRSLLSVGATVKFAKKSDVVQFHAITPFVLPLAVLVRLFSRARISSFIYGSDFLRANKIDSWCINKVFSLSASVVCDSSTVLEELKARYPQHASIMCCCYLGSPIIDNLLKQNGEIAVRHIESNGKKVIMCGYNGTKEQQHIKIINSLANVAHNYYWVFPMTYSNENKAYIETVRNLANEKKLDYIILDSFLSEEEWASYIQSTDIFIHMQVSDAFSSSISEHLLLGHILINGDWLPYKDLDENGVFYISSNFEELEKKLTDALNNYNTIEERLKENKEKIIKMKSLDYCVKNYWIPYFNEL